MTKSINVPKYSRLANAGAVEVVCGSILPQPAVAQNVVTQQQIVKLRAKALAAAALALDTLHGIITDNDARDADRIQASKVILQYSGLDADTPADGGRLNPGSMSRAELAEHVERMRQELAMRAAPVIDQ